MCSQANRWWASPPLPGPLPGGEREKKGHHPKTKRGPAFPPAPRCRHPLACPSGRRARRGGGRQWSASGKGLRDPAFQRSQSVRWPVTGTGAVPKSRVPASMSLQSLPALRRSGIAVRSSIDTIPEGSFHSITSRRFLCPKASSSVAAVAASSWPCPKGATVPLQPAPPGPKRGFASVASGSVRCPKAPAPARPPVIPGTNARDAIGRLSVPFPPGRCEHRPCGFPGWRPRPDPCGFPKAPARVRP